MTADDPPFTGDITVSQLKGYHRALKLLEQLRVAERDRDWKKFLECKLTVRTLLTEAIAMRHALTSPSCNCKTCQWFTREFRQ